MILLGIESSCDDTSAAVVCDRRVLANIVASQDAVHAPWGGVVPELAARAHLEAISQVVPAAMQQAGVDYGDLDGIAVTRGPGLMGSLLVGLSMARGLSLRTGAPVLGVNHLEGHVLSPLVEADLATPFLALVVSGGHTTLYLVREIGDYAQVASTRDDAAGEAFDKGAKMLGLGYPGGRVIDETARGGDRRAIRLPRGRVKADPMALSFSGLKTALSLWLERGEEVAIADVCASFQEAIVDVLVDRTRSACARLDVPRVAVCGGVSANSRLREAMGEMGRAEGVSVVFPPMSLCTDNAAMIAHAAWRRLERGLDAEEPVAVSRLPLGPRLVLP